MSVMMQWHMMSFISPPSKAKNYQKLELVRWQIVYMCETHTLVWLRDCPHALPPALYPT